MNKNIKNILVLVMILAAIFGFFWLANFLGSGEKAQSEKPLVICNQQKCFWTAHIHATVRVFRDGTEIPVRFEEGELEGQHTHSEPNKLHWHGLIPVNSKTKEVTDWSSFSIERLLKDLSLSIEDGPQIIVNDKEVDLWHIWQDGDTIEIRYVK